MIQITTISRGMAYTLLLIAISSFSVKAQISREACQTVVPDRIYEQMRREAPIINRIRNEASGRSATASTDTVPIFFTVFQNDDGSFADPIVDEALVDQALAQLNQYFTPIHLHFIRLGEINYINNTAFTKFNVHNHLSSLSYLSTALNVYTKSGSGSFAQFPAVISPTSDSLWSDPMTDRSNMISLNSNNFINISFAHEMGHSYGLLHTFEGAQVYNNPLAPTPGYNGAAQDHPYGIYGNIRRRELVIRQTDSSKDFVAPNHENAGDFVGDTPAFCVSTTQFPSYYPTRGGENCESYPFDKYECNGCIVVDCNYEGDYVDYNGDTLVNTQVSIKNIMSYTNCRSEFTPGQYERMRFYHENMRKSQYDASQNINYVDTVFFEDSKIPMDDIVVQISHPTQYRHSNAITDQHGRFQAILYDQTSSVKLMKAGSNLDPNYRSSPWVQASVEEVIAHSYQASDWLKGVDEADLALLQKHLSGTDTLNGFQQIAADLNNDGMLSEADVQLLQQFLAGHISLFDQHTSPWRFLPAYIAEKHAILFHSNPFNMEIEGINYEQFAAYLEDDWTYNIEQLPVGMRGFRGIKLGDLDSSSIPPLEVEAFEETSVPEVVNIETPKPKYTVNKFGCFPNPTIGDLTVVFKADLPEEGNLIITNRFFRTLYQKDVEIVEGQNEFHIEDSSLPADMLVVMLKTKEKIFYKKVIKINN